MIDFGKQYYGESLKNLKQVITLNPRSPPSVWFGIGLCYYRLGNQIKAKIAFQRVLDMDPKHSMANTALTILETQCDQVARADEERRQKAARNLETAVKSDRNNPLALRLLADHYFQ
jgi:RNA polymerase-associated protein CTR9